MRIGIVDAQNIKKGTTLLRGHVERKRPRSALLSFKKQRSPLRETQRNNGKKKGRDAQCASRKETCRALFAQDKNSPTQEEGSVGIRRKRPQLFAFCTEGKRIRQNAVTRAEQTVTENPAQPSKEKSQKIITTKIIPAKKRAKKKWTLEGVPTERWLKRIGYG